MTTCEVCGAHGAETHFGGICCKACAAFFRRHFHSKNVLVSCTCGSRIEGSHPCRECRIKKCLKAGMTTKKIQQKREQNSKSISLPPKIISCDISKISHVVSKWVNVQDKRSLHYGKRLDEMTYYGMCSANKSDCETMWNVIEMAIPQLENLGRRDKNALLRNFLPKWSMLAAAIDFYKNRDAYQNIRSADDYSNMVSKFYSNSVYADSSYDPDELARVFVPFLCYYGTSVALPIFAKKFNPMEYMALALISLFDGAHTNLSPEVSNLCHNIRNLILRELRGYHSNLEEKEEGEMRFIETIDTLSLIERGESKFQEELLLLEMYNIHIHDDYRLMLREHNY